jgi:pSer/pThr/pTyr-binding forkhead associated (FHA) protein
MPSKSETEESSASLSDAPARHVLVAFVDALTIPFELPLEGTVTLGRSSSCELVLDHPSISREHARVHAGAGFTIEDLGSRNGTRVRGVPLAAHQPVTLQAGDVVECGDATLLLRALSRARLASTTPPAPAPRAREVVIGADGRTLRAPGVDEVNLGRRGPLRRVLLELARQRVASPGVGLSLDAVLEAGWPGEKMDYDAGVARVYTTIQRLRALGLQGILVTHDDGYLLDPGAAVRLETEGA